VPDHDYEIDFGGICLGSDWRYDADVMVQCILLCQWQAFTRWMEFAMNCIDIPELHWVAISQAREIPLRAYCLGAWPPYPEDWRKLCIEGGCEPFSLGGR
jgi:hypothetical protein